MWARPAERGGEVRGHCRKHRKEQIMQPTGSRIPVHSCHGRGQVRGLEPGGVQGRRLLGQWAGKLGLWRTPHKDQASGCI